MLKIAIVDDNIEFLNLYRRKVSGFFINNNIEVKIATFMESDSFLKQNEKYDLYFLDIELQDTDGMQLAEIIRQKYGDDVDIIFVTMKETAVYDAFMVDAVGFIRKSLMDSDFDKTMEKYIKRYHDRTQKYEFRIDDGKYIYKSIDDIMYAEIYGHMLRLYCIDGVYDMRCSLDELTAMLPEEDILEPYRGYIVNCKYVEHITDEAVILDNGKKILLSRRKRDEVRKKYLHFLNRIT